MPRIETPSPPGEVSGITLHVEACGEQPAAVLTYRKAQSHSIAVGRKPTQVNDGAVEAFVDRALFKCPVVSRKHAKITFTDFGNAYITDMHSHHGTHILRPGQSVAKTIEPNTLAVLADGDVLTFGKTVGKDEQTVHPVVAKVKLIIAKEEQPPAPSLALLTPEPVEKPTGRYAVPSSSSSSSSSSDMSCSDDEDDADDHSAASSSPSPVAAPRPSLSERRGRLAFLRRILPPVHSLYTHDDPTDFTLVPPFGLQLPPIPRWPEPSVGAYPASASPSRHGSPSSDMQLSDGLPSPEPSALNLPSFSLHGYEYPLANVSDDEEVLEEQQFDLVTPSLEPRQDENELTPAELDEAIRDYYSKPVEPPTAAEVATVMSDFSAPSARPETRVRDDELAALNTRINEIRSNIEQLREARQTNESHFEEQMQDAKVRVDELREHMDVNVMTRVRANASILADYGARVEEMQRRMEKYEDHMAEASTAEKERADGAGKMEEISAMLREVKAMRDAAMQDLTLQLEAIQLARIEAERAIAASMRDARNQLALSRKRKASDLDDDAPVQLPVVTVYTSTPAPKRRRIMRIASAVGKTAAVATVGAVAAWTALAFA